MPHLFPNGIGHYNGESGGLNKYLKQRMHCGLSLFTLYPAYLLLMYMARQTHNIVQSVKKRSLARDLKR